MKRITDFVVSSIVAGFLIILPVYLAIILLLKAMKSAAGLVKPFVSLIPAWLPAERLLSLLLVLAVAFLIGALLKTEMGRAARKRIETSIFQKIPGYGIVHALTQQLAGQSQDGAWQSALVEIEDALVPGFIIETLDDGRLTVFVPSVPTPMAGTIYVLEPSRVHVVDVPFTQAARVVTRWGAGSKALVAAMRPKS